MNYDEIINNIDGILYTHCKGKYEDYKKASDEIKAYLLYETGDEE